MIGSCTGVCVSARACMYDFVIRMVSVNLHVVMSPTGNIFITPWLTEKIRLQIFGSPDFTPVLL